MDGAHTPKSLPMGSPAAARSAAPYRLAAGVPSARTRPRMPTTTGSHGGSFRTTLASANSIALLARCLGHDWEWRTLWRKEPPERASWLPDLEAELFVFPGSRHDDQCDSVSQALLDKNNSFMTWLSPEDWEVLLAKSKIPRPRPPFGRNGGQPL
jgi:hypothetical protein